MTLALTRIGSFLTPILFAVFPALSLFAQNQTDVALSVLWLPLVICVAAVVLLFGLFLLLARRATKAGALASVVVVWFFYYGVFYENVSGLGLTSGWFFALWTAVFAAIAYAIARERGPLSSLLAIAAVGAAALAVPAAARVASYQVNHPAISLSDQRLWPSRLPPPADPSRRRAPDIYVLIPDDYARLDILRRYFRYDDAAFLRALRARGFAISSQSRSPYSDSESNMAATLNLAYLDGLPRILGPKSQDVRPVKRLIQDNRASRLLKAIGYRYVHIDTDEVTFAGSNPAISRFAPPDSFANLWMHKSVLRLVGGPLGFDQSAMNARFRESIRSQFGALACVPRQRGPKFVVFHTLLPHDPYVFSANGRPVTFPATSDAALGGKIGMRWYLGQLRFLNRRLLAAIDTIRARSTVPPIIVLQSDEGFQADPDTVGEAAMRDIRVKGLAAFYLPGRRRAGVPEPPNTVNTLRFVFDTYLGTHYAMLRSASYPEGDYPYQYEEMRVR